MILTAAERQKFAEYCEAQAFANTGILEQMKKLKIPEVVIQARQEEIKAFSLIAKILRSTHSS